jgi:hypothetical protein
MLGLGSLNSEPERPFSSRLDWRINRGSRGEGQFARWQEAPRRQIKGARTSCAVSTAEQQRSRRVAGRGKKKQKKRRVGLGWCLGCWVTTDSKACLPAAGSLERCSVGKAWRAWRGYKQGAGALLGKQGTRRAKPRDSDREEHAGAGSKPYWRERNYHVVSDALRAGLQRQPESPSGSAAESREQQRDGERATPGSSTRRRGRDEQEARGRPGELTEGGRRREGRLGRRAGAGQMQRSNKSS